MAPDHPIRTIEVDEERRLVILDEGSGQTAECTVRIQRSGGVRRVVAELADGSQITASSTLDFEEALGSLREQFEQRGLLLLCNRFRKDAFVSSMARQMSDGLGCYLVEPRVPVNPERIVDAVGSAPRELVVSQQEAAAFIEAWIDGFGE